MPTSPYLLAIVAELCLAPAFHVLTPYTQLNNVLTLVIGAHCQFESFLQPQAHLIVAMAFVLKKEALPAEHVLAACAKQASLFDALLLNKNADVILTKWTYFKARVFGGSELFHPFIFFGIGSSQCNQNCIFTFVTELRSAPMRASGFLKPKQARLCLFKAA